MTRLHDPWADDDEPIPDEAPAPAPVGGPDPELSNRYVRVSIPDGRIPSDIRIDTAFTSSIAPQNYGSRILDAYHLALWESEREALERADFSRLAAIPSPTELDTALVRASTLEELDELEDLIRRGGETRAVSARCYDGGDPVVVLHARYFILTALEIHSTWRTFASSSDLGAEFMVCCDTVGRGLRRVREAQDYPASVAPTRADVAAHSHALTIEGGTSR